MVGKAFLIFCAAGAALQAQQYRAFWADAFHRGFKTPAQVDQMVADVAAANCNAIFAEVRLRGNSYFLKSLEPPAQDAEYSPSFDALQYMIERAHGQGIEVHAWFPVTPLWPSFTVPPVDPNHAWNKHGPSASGDDMWLTIDSTGKLQTSVDPGHPDAFQYLADVILEPAKNYELDGIHLDYIRYPETGVNGYNPVALRRFQRLYGRTDVPAALDSDFSAFRREQVTALVRQIYLRAFSIRRNIKISAAVITWGNGPTDDQQFKTKDAYSRVFQDWRGWLEEGILDIAIPMNYFREDQLPAYLDRWMEFEKDRQYGRMTLVGLASYLNSIPDSLKQLKRVVSPSLAGNAPAGVNFYSYASTNLLNDAGAPIVPNADFYRAVGDFFGGPAAVPDLPWKSNPGRGHLYGWLKVDGGPAWLKDGVTVWIESDTGGDFVKKTATDATGFFGALELPPDRYRVRLERDGQEFYRSVPQDVAAGQAAVFEISLHDYDLPTDPMAAAPGSR